MTVTQGNRNAQAEQTGTDEEGKVRNRARGRASARLRLNDTDSHAEPDSGTHAPSRTLGNYAGGLGRRIRGAKPYAARPASVRDVVDYTRAGGWIPGDHPWWWESPGYAYGVLIAIPATITLYIASWVLQKMGRVFAVCLIYSLLLITGVQFGTTWVDAILVWLGLSLVSLILVLGGKRE